MSDKYESLKADVEALKEKVFGTRAFKAYDTVTDLESAGNDAQTPPVAG